MPEQETKRGLAVTKAPIEDPWETPTIALGLKGINLTDDIERVEPGEYVVLDNAYHLENGALTSRGGLSSLATATASNAHSAARLNIPASSTYTRVWGAGTVLNIGQSGALTQIDTGYSGNPLCLLAHRPTTPSGTWMLVADSNKIRQVRTDGLVLTLGLDAPTTKATAALGTLVSTAIGTFADGEPLNSTVWTSNPGYDYSDTPLQTGIPLANSGGSSVEFVTRPGPDVEAAARGYWSFWGAPITLDLSKLGTGAAVDDDFIHVEVKVSHPQLTTEVRVYFVCSNDFSASTLPGTVADQNSEFYVVTFKQNAFAAMMAAQMSQAEAAKAAAAYGAVNQALENNYSKTGKAARPGALTYLYGKTPALPPPPNSDLTALLAQAELGRGQALQLGSGSTWVEYGVVGNTLRRGDFMHFGQTTGRNWSTITGVVIYIQAAPKTGGPIAVAFHDMYLHGGSGIDSADGSTNLYDWRYTNYDPRTGDESNPSPVMDPTTIVTPEPWAASPPSGWAGQPTQGGGWSGPPQPGWAGTIGPGPSINVENYIATARRAVNVTPTAYGDSNVRQRFYRRGGTLNDNWYFEGENASDGGVFSSSDSDEAIALAGTVAIDHYRAVPTVDANGNTVLAQPVRHIFGPVNGLLFAIGDPYRPGHVAYCIPDQPGHWPATYNAEVTPPSEELMAGCIYGGSPFVFSRERGYALYPQFGPDTVVVTSSAAGCQYGLIATTGLVSTAYGIFGVSKTGVFRTQGLGMATLVTGKLEKLFYGESAGGYLPIDQTATAAIRLIEHQDEIYFQYQDTSGARHVWVYSPTGEYWRPYRWLNPTHGACLADDFGNPEPMLIVGDASGTGFSQHDLSAFSDNGTAIAVTAQLGSWDYGRPREDKLLGDQYVDLDCQGLTITVQNTLNGEVVTNAAQTITGGVGRVRSILDGFTLPTGEPQQARTVSTIFTWSSATVRPELFRVGIAIKPQPDLTINRVTQWDDCGHADPKWMSAVTFDCDTQGVARTIIIEGDYNGAIVTLATLTVNHNGRHKETYSWAAQDVHMIRVRPNDDCKAWQLYRADWIWQAEPPNISGWDTGFENLGDTYYTGVDLFCDTFGATKTVLVYIDETLIATLSVVANGRLLKHFDLPWGRGHVYRLVATDSNRGMLYSHEWKVAKEPGEQANWNQNFSPMGTLADKWFKAFLFEVDTFGQNKLVDIEIDGVVVETLTVNTNGRRVVHQSLSQQRLGRILRVFPSDSFASRPYTITPIFDIEPYALTRWEFQETDDGVAGFKTWTHGNITLVSTAEVTYTRTIQRSQSGDGARVTQTYTIPSTAGVKLDLYVPFEAVKGVKVKRVFTSSGALRLYREESTEILIPWGARSPMAVHPFGNDDLTVPTRSMMNAELAASRSGGGAS